MDEHILTAIQPHESPQNPSRISILHKDTETIYATIFSSIPEAGHLHILAQGYPVLPENILFTVEAFSDGHATLTPFPDTSRKKIHFSKEHTDSFLCFTETLQFVYDKLVSPFMIDPDRAWDKQHHV